MCILKQFKESENNDKDEQYDLIQTKYQQKHHASKFQKTKYKPQKYKLLRIPHKNTLLKNKTHHRSVLKKCKCFFNSKYF